MAMLTCLAALARDASGGKGDVVTRSGLQKAGFPASYVAPLLELHRRHPKWRFVPLMVTRLAPQYTWEYVLRQETENPSRSLVSGSKTFAAYRHPTDTANYDAGCRRASTAAVSFFLDPRNFLNERDIFQFEELSGAGKYEEKDVRGVLHKTTWEDFTLENGKSVCAYLLEVGKELNVSPLHLAARMRMEQGNGTPLVSGHLGTLLHRYYTEQLQEDAGKPVLPPPPGSVSEKLLEYDGLYNFFNIEAAGTGRFTIYLNGMREAFKGTPEKVQEWGAPVWDTRWKAIYGGALKVARNYIANFQNTRYLQKWNVDVRCKTPKGSSRNFWGQYMQNISAAHSEACQTYLSLQRNDLLELPFVFLIPVYDGMPEAVCPDPADGKCPYVPPAP